ncbi:hypothetical protein R1sor_019907 [Riccia sorocarpa]|uniref:Uncharacterized protein n=1 Tax=Riccia sorocarpa TaxID=122646 RepID=A0ABD3IHN3_9MARC
MVDVEHRIHAQYAGLKRLSQRAHAGPAPASNGGRRVFFSFAAYARTVIDHLRNCGVEIEKGLSEKEFGRVEATHSFTFPPDLRAILAEGLPVGPGFPDWRHGISEQLQMRFDLPIAGLLYEVAKGSLWRSQWGPRPVDTEQAIRLALISLRKVSSMVPVYSQCYIPASPNIAGNPVFFLHMKEAFISGIDIADFFLRELFVPHGYKEPRNLPDLSEWVDDCGSRIARLSSGRDMFIGGRVGGRIVSGKENLLIPRKVCEEEAEVPHFEHGPVQEDEEKKFGEVVDSSFESWGRSLDSLGKHSDVMLKSLDNFGRRSSSKAFDFHPKLDNLARSTTGLAKNHIQDCLARFKSFEECPISANAVAHFSKNAPSWTSKARRIEFWTELTEKRNSSSLLTSEKLLSAPNVDVGLDNFTPRCGVEDQSLTEYRNTHLPKWLVNYLEDVTLRLRKGGWNEVDIDEMMDLRRPAKKVQESSSDKQSVLASLTKQAEMLQAQLRAAGWSMRDVAEVLTSDMKLADFRKRSASDLPNEVATLASSELRRQPLAIYIRRIPAATIGDVHPPSSDVGHCGALWQ